MHQINIHFTNGPGISIFTGQEAGISIEYFSPAYLSRAGDSRYSMISSSDTHSISHETSSINPAPLYSKMQSFP